MINVKDQKFIKKFGKRIRQLRLERDMTQATLTEKADLGKNQLSLIETGEINPSLSTIKALAKGLDVSLSELFDF